MNFKPAELLNPVFNFLDALISDYGIYLYLVFVWLSLAVIAWVLGGGLRRRQPLGNSGTVNFGIIFTTRPPNQSPPPEQRFVPCVLCSRLNQPSLGLSRNVRREKTL